MDEIRRVAYPFTWSFLYGLLFTSLLLAHDSSQGQDITAVDVSVSALSGRGNAVHRFQWLFHSLSLLFVPFQRQSALVTWLLDFSVWQGFKAATENAERIVRLLLMVGKLKFCALLSDPFNAASSALLFSPKDFCR